MTDRAEFDFETYSEAGYVWDAEAGKYRPPKGARDKGLNTVGAAAYAQHPSTEVLTLTYKFPAWFCERYGLPFGAKYRWRPGEPNPEWLFFYLTCGGLLEAHNVMFERLIWRYVCVPKYGWPDLEPHQYQLRCSMAKARVHALPGPLANLGDVLNIATKKDPDGKRLLDKFSVPRNPTKNKPYQRLRPEEDPEDFERLRAYCDRDVDAEAAASALMPDMTPDELLFWWIDQEINWRGVGIDRQGVRDCIAILDQALEQYGEEFRQITGGLNPTQLEATRGWLAGRGVHMPAMDEATIDDALTWPHVQGDARRVLEIRQLIGSASVKKLYAMENQASADDRLRNLIVHHGARTGRPTGGGPQPLNLPKAGPDLKWCGMLANGDWGPIGCRRPFKVAHTGCPWCGNPVAGALAPKREWSAEAADAALEVIGHGSLELVEWFFGDALLTISGCLRGLFVAAPGHDLIASDYSAIEAVVTAMLAKEEWRIEAFRKNLPIYLLSAAKITGRTLEEYEQYKAETGQHHPDRQKIGKVNELANGFGGWIGASRNFGADEPDDVIKQRILAWRSASPNIVEMWGGQKRRIPWEEGGGWREEYYGFEGAAVQALRFPGHAFEANGIWFFTRETALGQALIVRLLSGRELTYHQARLSPARQEWAKSWEVSITYMTWNTNPTYGAMGWVPMSTYGGRLTENIVQAIAHDILRFAIINLRAAGYPTVLHVYDEIVVEVPHGLGSLEEVERIMSTMPWWAAGWPIRASGGWRGRRYRKG